MSRESIFRIPLVTFVIIIWAMMIIFPVRNALANDDDKPKPPGGTPTPTGNPPPIVQPAAPGESNNRKSENLVGGILVSGIATNVLRNQEYGYLWAFGATVAGVVAVESLHSDPRMSNIWYGVGGAALGTVGSCKLLVAKNYLGCAIPF